MYKQKKMQELIAMGKVSIIGHSSQVEGFQDYLNNKKIKFDISRTFGGFTFTLRK